MLHRGLIALCVAASACGGSPSDVKEDGPIPAPGITIDDETLASLESLSPAELPAPPEDISNRFADDPRAARLGQQFFFDAGFSGQLLDGDNGGDPTTLGVRGQAGRVSCAGCHVPDGGFSDTRTYGGQVSLGAGWSKRRTPSLLDVGQAKLLMWDGRHDAFFNQPFGPIESSVEMNSSRLFAAQHVWRNYREPYEALFGPLPNFGDAARFTQLTPETAGCELYASDPQVPCHGRPGTPEFDQLSPEDQDAVTQVVVNIGKALGAYQRLLSCGPSRFDAWMHGDATALTASEQRGALVFTGRGDCVRCHSGPYFSDQKFHNVGLQPAFVAVIIIDLDDHGARDGLTKALADPLNVRGSYSDGDDGRLPDEVDPSMDGAFRTPTLRCVSQRPSFFHTGQVLTLANAVHFLSRAAPGVYPGTSEIAPLGLTGEEEADLTAFLEALDGPGAASALRGPPE